MSARAAGAGGLRTCAQCKSMASGESGSEPFTFNFFASATLVKQSPQQQQHQQRQHPHPAGSNSGSDGDEHEKAAAEAQEAAAAEAQADALLAAAAGGAGEGPVDWHYTQVAEELELTSWQETQSKVPWAPGVVWPAQCAGGAWFSSHFQ